jgi:hypothetical protein
VALSGQEGRVASHWMFLGGEDSLAGKDCVSSSGPIDVGGGFGRHGGGARESWASQQQSVAGSGFGTAGLLPSSGANRAKVSLISVYAGKHTNASATLSYL